MKEQLSRLMQASHCRNQAELAGFLGVRQALLSDALRRGHLPREWFAIVQKKKGVSAVWLSTGQGDLFAEKEETRAAGPETIRYCLGACPVREMAEELLRAVGQCPCLCERALPEGGKE